jgi:hypothetical protein
LKNFQALKVVVDEALSTRSESVALKQLFKQAKPAPETLAVRVAQRRVIKDVCCPQPAG